MKGPVRRRRLGRGGSIVRAVAGIPRDFPENRVVADRRDTLSETLDLVPKVTQVMSMLKRGTMRDDQGLEGALRRRLQHLARQRRSIGGKITRGGLKTIASPFQKDRCAMRIESALPDHVVSSGENQSPGDDGNRPGTGEDREPVGKRRRMNGSGGPTTRLQALAGHKENIDFVARRRTPPPIMIVGKAIHAGFRRTDGQKIDVAVLGEQAPGGRTVQNQLIGPDPVGDEVDGGPQPLRIDETGPAGQQLAARQDGAHAPQNTTAGTGSVCRSSGGHERASLILAHAAEDCQRHAAPRAPGRTSSATGCRRSTRPAALGPAGARRSPDG